MSIPRYSYSSERERRRVVLLVEDERFVREATCRILQHAGFEVLAASDMEEALRIYEENPNRVDLLMTDLVLPTGSGRQIGDHIRRRSTGIPVLLTSGYLCSDEQEDPADDSTYYLAKPYSKSDLEEKLAQIFRMPTRAAAQAG